MTIVRRLLAVLALWVPGVIIAITWLTWQERLPADLPTHWGSSGPADAATSAPVFFGWLLGAAGVTALLGSVLVLVPLSGRWVRRAIGAAAGAVAAFVLSMWLGSTVPSLDVTDPFTVELGAWVLVTFLAPCYGLIPLFLLPPGDSPPVEPQETAKVEPLVLTDSQAVAWSRTMSSGLFIGTTILMVALGVLLFAPPIVRDGFTAVGWTLIPYCAAVLLVAVFCAYRVSADWRGLRVTSLLFGIPLKRIAPDQIAQVEAAVLEPTQWGGWGYRIMPGRSAIILRNGPGMVITQRNEKQFSISLDRPEEPASILLGLIAPARPSAGARS